MSWSLPRLHAIVAWLFVATIVIQVFLAGAAISQLGGTGVYATHIDFGYTVVGLAALAVLVTAVIARAGRPAILASVGLLVLYVIQTLLPLARTTLPAVAALHPVNAALLFGLAAWYAVRAWRATSAR